MNRYTLLTSPTPAEVVREALRMIRDQVEPDGSVRGTPEQWRKTTCATLTEMHGADAPAKHKQAVDFIEKDRRVAAACWTSGLIFHPVVVIHALRVAERMPT